MTQKFNYCIGHYWDSNTKESIGCYMIHGQEVWYETCQEAQDTLQYVKWQSPDKDWQIFAVVPKDEFDKLSEKAWMYDELQ